jgi:EAL domain-containing protein (putative c-di-GMP-specific phosphodiesterase class I)
LAQGLGIVVTAEGIETPEQLGLLRELGCDRGQGFLFSRPLTASAAAEALLQGRAAA